MKVADENDVRTANENVVEIANDGLKTTVAGHPGSGATATSMITITTFADGNVITRVGGLVMKTQLFGALVEAILSIHEVERNAALGEIMAGSDALYEKINSKERTDN